MRVVNCLMNDVYTGRLVQWNNLRVKRPIAQTGLTERSVTLVYLRSACHDQ